MDNFTLTTNLYPGFDVGAGASWNNTPYGESNGNISLHLNNVEFNGNIHLVGDTLSCTIDSSTVVPVSDFHAHGIALFGNHAAIACTEVEVSGHAIDGIHVQSGSAAEVKINGCRISNNGKDGIDFGQTNHLEILNSLVDANSQNGIRGGGQVVAYQSSISHNGSIGMSTSGSINMNHMSLATNGDCGVAVNTPQSSTILNSVVWGNNASNAFQIDAEGGFIVIQYSSILGIDNFGLSGTGEYSVGQGCGSFAPLFVTDSLALAPHSLCVDGGQPWTTDAFMPEDLVA